MARRSKSRKPSNMEPAVMTMTFISSPVVPGVNTIDHIDLSQVASLCNRRFYRQGLNWAVAGVKVLAPVGFTGSIALHQLPNTWVLSNAWKKSLAVWSQMNNEALAESDSVRPRFLDFKIFADATHHTNGFGQNLLPTSAAGGVYTPGEWESAKIFHPVARGALEGATIEEEVIAVGASFPGVSPVSGLNAVSMIEGYAASRLLPNIRDPNAPADIGDTDNATPENWMAAVFNEGTEQTSDVLVELTTENNIAPYPFEGDGVNLDTMYPGGANQGPGLQVHDLQYLTGTSIGSTTRLKGGNFPCGLMQIVSTNGSETPNSLIFQVDLIPGRHRGYLAESMQEM
jgi:hypothetical protein